MTLNNSRGLTYIAVNSSSFGQQDGFALYAKIKKGKAQFRVQSSGQWKISLTLLEDVIKNDEFKDIYGKADKVYSDASLTFNVK